MQRFWQKKDGNEYHYPKCCRRKYTFNSIIQSIQMKIKSHQPRIKPLIITVPVNRIVFSANPRYSSCNCNLEIISILGLNPPAIIILSIGRYIIVVTMNCN